MSPQSLAANATPQRERVVSATEWCLADTDLAPLRPVDLLHVASFYSTSHRPGDRLYLGILRDGLFFVRRDTDTGAETIVSHSRENLERFTLTAEERVRLGVEA